MPTSITKLPATVLITGSTYRLYGKLTGMERMRAIGGNRFPFFLADADLFKPKTQADLKQMAKELDYLNNSQGHFEYRLVSGPARIIRRLADSKPNAKSGLLVLSKYRNAS